MAKGNGNGNGMKRLPPAVQEAMRDLTPVEQRFVMAFCGEARGNGTLAAKLAGVKGVKSTLAVRASQLLREPHIRNARDVWMEHFALGPAEVTAALSDLAGCHLGPFLERDPADGTIKIKVPDDAAWETFRHWIKGVEVDPKSGEVTKIQIHDRLAALRELAKILKLYSDAPQWSLQVYYNSLSDEEVLAEWEEAKKRTRGRIPIETTSRQVKDTP